MRIALLEDDIDQARIFHHWLSKAGHICQVYDATQNFRKSIATESYDVLIMGWMAPRIQDFESIRWVRNNVDWHIPILFTTHKESEDDIVSALEYGADDFMVKPIKPTELFARINTLRRRSQAKELVDTKLDFSPFELDSATRSISIDGVAVEVTHKEFDLAYFLFSNVGRVLSRGHILESVWGRSSEINTRTVDTHVSRLRNKLGLCKEKGWQLSAIYQHGYRLERIERPSSFEPGLNHQVQ